MIIYNKGVTMELWKLIVVPTNTFSEVVSWSLAASFLSVFSP